jgi:hypothetical protein
MSKDPETGKSAQEGMEEAWDEIAESEGIDDHGDPVEVDDDEPALAAETEEAPEVEEPEAPEIEASDEETEEVEEPEASDDPQLAPHTWSEEWKGDFNALDPAGQKLMLKVNGEFNKAFTQNMTQLAGVRREQEGIKNAVQPHSDWLQRAGLTPEIALQRALGWERHIMANPVQGAIEFLQARGVDLGQVTQQLQPPENEQYLTPSERQQRSEMNQTGQALQQVTQRLDHMQNSQQNAWQQQTYDHYQNVLGNFIQATDDAGSLTHPYMEHVANDMTEMVYAARQRGEEPNLERIYEDAVWKNPTTREAQLKNWQTNQAQKNQQSVAKARKASGSIVSKSSSGTTKNAPRTAEQNVAAAWEQNANA